MQTTIEHFLQYLCDEFPEFKEDPKKYKLDKALTYYEGKYGLYNYENLDSQLAGVDREDYDIDSDEDVLTRLTVRIGLEDRGIRLI